MKNLQNIIDIIGIHDFNDIVISWLAGDDIDWVFETLDDYKTGYIPDNDQYMYKLFKAGYNDDNWPRDAFDDYCKILTQHIKSNLIIPLP